ncbi:MAG TPA: hypothetical protein DIC64_00750 [Alphaproteobacteria bacterium]|nr:hypothetical protein [Alphaproteobacteria bacterium]
MAQKGSKYKRKHTVEESDRAAEEEREIAENPYMAVLYHDEGYIDEFLNLSIGDACIVYDMLYKSAKTDEDDAKKLNKVLAAAGFKVAEHAGRFLHKQELLTIRMDFYGTIDRIKDGLRERELSPYYRNLIAKPLRESPQSEEYDFESSPSWKLFSRFESFRIIEEDLRLYLFQKKIDPQILQLMTPRDFSDLVVQAFQKDDKEQKVTFQKGITVRNEFVRDLARHQGNQMADMLLNQGWDKRYVHSMINMMHRYGKYNSAKLIITEMNFTPRVLSDLKKAEKELFAKIKSAEFSILKKEEKSNLKKLLKEVAKANAQQFKAGDVIPQTLINAAIDAKNADFIIARDETGKPLNSADFPSFEVHHKYAASDAGALQSVAYANYKDKLCLVTAEIHSRFIHGHDKIRKRGQTKSYSERLEFIDPNTVFVIGLKPEERLSYDFYQGKRDKRRNMDDKHVVNYEECMKKLALDQAAYDREHSKCDIKKEFENYSSYRKLKKARKMFLKKGHSR